MKVNGVDTKEATIFGPLTFKRGDSFLAFYAQPVWDLDEFNAKCPYPKNEYTRFTRNGKEADPEAPGYLDQVNQYALKRWGYTILKSLEPSNIEWESVSLSDPKTWDKVEQELKASLGLYEFAKLMDLIDEANGLDEAKLEANAETFFQLSRAAAADTSENSQKDEPESSS